VTENLSTISMGVEHFGQRKQVGWAGEEVTTSGDGTGKKPRGKTWSKKRRRNSCEPSVMIFFLFPWA
jgi:hypothetical protein